VTRAVGTTMVDSQPVTREAVPTEVYRIQNNPQLAPRANLVVTVGPEAPWTVALEPAAVTLAPGGGPVTVKARLTRRGAPQDLPFAVVGLPPGVQGPRSLLFKRGMNELSFTLAPPRGGGTPERFTLAIVNGREGEGMMMASPPVPVTLAPSR
jgi:hypothetical protein